MTSLAAVTRTTLGKRVKALRRQHQIPGIVYGHGTVNCPVAVKRLDFDKVYRQVGESTLIDLAIEGKAPVKVLIQDVQLHSLKGTVEHIDFHQVRMNEKLTVDIPLKYLGEPKAVKELGGILVKNVDHLKVECLPQDLVHEIEVDLSGLVEFNQGVQLKDLRVPSGLKVLSPAPEEVLVTVMPPRSEAELEALKAEVKEDVSQVERVEEKPAEGAETTVAEAEPAAAAKKEKAAPKSS